MFEKVNPSHPDKIADRIAGAIVDRGYAKNEHPKMAVEVLIGHGECFIVNETSEHFTNKEISDIVERIVKNPVVVKYVEVPQDKHLAYNQKNAVRCGDNGIFKGVPLTEEQKELSAIARKMYVRFPYDGKHILDGDKLTVCQSMATTDDVKNVIGTKYNAVVNPLGYWTGGIDVDSGATNRKLGSDMADSVTGGGLHGKDLSKADVSANIYAFLKAQKTSKTVELSCSIGDEMIDGRPYSEVVDIARSFIKSLGGFEKFAEWGLF